MEITTEELLRYEPKIPYAIETAKDLLKLLGKEPTNRNALIMCYIAEKVIK